jgi:hypothetical protein
MLIEAGHTNLQQPAICPLSKSASNQPSRNTVNSDNAIAML